MLASTELGVPRAVLPEPEGVRLILDRVGLVAVVAGSFCAPLSWTLGEGGVLLTVLFYLLAAACQLPWFAQESVRLGVVPSLLIVGGLIVLASGVVGMALDQPMAEPVTPMKLLFALVLFPILLLLAARGSQVRIEWVLMAWLAGASLSASVALAGRFGIGLLGMHDPAAATGRAFGIALHPNQLGYTSALVAPVAVYFLQRARSLSTRMLLAAVLLLLLSGVHLSGSRSALLALMLAALIPALGMLRLNNLWLVMFGTLAVLLVVLLGVLMMDSQGQAWMNRIEESAIGRALGLSGSSAGADAGRMDFIRYSWRAFLDSPWVGQGYGWLQLAHMHVVAILHSGGLLGLSAFLVWLAGVATMMFRVAAATRTPRDPRRRLWWAVFGGLSVWFINGALQPSLPDLNGYILVGALLVLDVQVRQGARVSVSR